MAAQRGRDLLIKIANESGSFTTLAGLRSKALKFNAKLVDITHSESLEGWRELLPGAGVKSMQITGSGIFKNSESDALARTAFFEQSPKIYRIIIPGFGVLEGEFLISALSYAGNYDGEANYDLTLSSASAPNFTAL